MAVISVEKAGGKNVVAFIDMLAWSEGTSRSKYTRDDGYDVIVNGIGGSPKTFSDYSKHPNILVKVNSSGLKSTAAGRYQFLKRTWDGIVSKYGFKGRMIPEAQDLGAIKLLIECGAYPLIQAGRIREAIAKAAPIWASLPGAGYGQPEHAADKLISIYEQKGGTLA